MPQVIEGPGGRLEIETRPLQLRFSRGEQIALLSGGPAFFVHNYGVETALELRETDEGASSQDGARRFTLGVPGDEATATLEVSTTASGFRLVLIGPPRVVAVGLTLRMEPGGPWYGGGERIVQLWPLSLGPVVSEPFISADNAEDGTLDIVTPLWFGSGIGQADDRIGPAVGLLADSGGELAVTLNRGGDGLISISSRPFTAQQASLDGAPAAPVLARLTLDVILADDIAAAFRAALPEIGHPSAIPPETLFEQPIWTTWARYKMGIDQQTTLAFAADIVAHGFGRSVMEIDDRWQATYGELRFDPLKFPDPAAMVAALHEQGFAVTLWVPPFFHPASPAYDEAAANGYLVRHPASDGPYMIRWWQGYGGMLDVSNAEALAWWLAALRRLQQEYGIDGYKFDAGEALFLPTDALTAQPIRRTDYTDLYVNFVATNFPLSEVRAGYRGQREPIFFREWDKWSRWGLDNGLHASITQALALSLAGYPFILPDMIGGNAYDREFPDKELLIRWTQMNALLPAMQFSLPPWELDEATATICRRYSELHAQFAPYIIELARQAALDGTPIIRPLFWHFPTDRAAYELDDEYLLGDRYLAAPVVEQGAQSRDVYLPVGRWRDYWNGEEHAGGLLRDYPTPLEVLPLFEWLGEA